PTGRTQNLTANTKAHTASQSSHRCLCRVPEIPWFNLYLLISAGLCHVLRHPPGSVIQNLLLLAFSLNAFLLINLHGFASRRGCATANDHANRPGRCPDEGPSYRFANASDEVRCKLARCLKPFTKHTSGLLAHANRVRQTPECCFCCVGVGGHFHRRRCPSP